MSWDLFYEMPLVLHLVSDRSFSTVYFAICCVVVRRRCHRIAPPPPCRLTKYPAMVLGSLPGWSTRAYFKTPVLQ